ncbi:organic solvent ABC transporter [Paramagnetospirillum marisnigri]|uniref:Organic solvent ABC transporter n=1 Tax=Paramagnetospirillum marisnigri TaxID=1285242 RepID=A0A178MQX0_9PROT|nr:ABC transporter substrate-binding protein [Paramagnetospirillum marisnigri]OAN51343.1 organic solvent ABC transporter [Paramagnetospirillum marisnigri]
MSSPSWVRILLLLVAVTLSAPAVAAEADGTVKGFNDQLLAVMKAGPKLGFKGRFEKFRTVVSDSYDLTTITKSMLGTVSVAKLTPDELSRLVAVYADFSAATYASQFEAWDGEAFELGETRPHPTTAGAVVVQSWIVPKSGNATQIDYVLRPDQGRWRIIDVLFEGTVSQVAVRRSEFGAIFRDKGLAGLIEVIQGKTAAMEKK